MAKAATTTIDTSAYDYSTIRIRGRDGRAHYLKSNGDAVARAMALHTVINGKDPAQVIRANKIEMGKHTNYGQERMALGNKLRALVRAGQPVTIGEVVVKALDQKQPVLKADEPNGAPRKPAAKKAKAKKGRTARRKAPAAAAETVAA